jgi:hypothetical protein
MRASPQWLVVTTADGQERFIDRAHVIGYAFGPVAAPEDTGAAWVGPERFVARILMAAPGSHERPYTIVVEDDEAHQLRAILGQETGFAPPDGQE